MDESQGDPQPVGSGLDGVCSRGGHRSVISWSDDSRLGSESLADSRAVGKSLSL